MTYQVVHPLIFSKLIVTNIFDYYFILIANNRHIFLEIITHMLILR